ncbi:Afadin and alpha-actinin-binding-domain-containing protein [Suillus clintonianus]|uniref:Afadin and alpha-actinin-binding-domain-containing protein n=1 Tax=Suillus clintonianus TaxID=1904413 RepID=UPI001B86F153|nr:Afadin and alpha-actinin-binding-domain-containing protein [Suillus clintonianus]KAG2144348.1 Afadin and alpha-actinin-binding-domain-containing protein [Suillus clintonianus]
MADTPRKLVHWALDVSISDFGSPCSEATSSDSIASTSSLQYINSQLVAHGFTHSPGLSFEGLSNSDSDQLARCLLAMISQRVNDMSRAEDLSTSLRTLSYDHERLMGMHRSATEKAANAERETNVYKSRLVTASKTLAASESAHKQTSAELQRTRSSLIALRATHSTEIKKKEKDVERIIEKWSKLSDMQTKLSTSSSGLTFRCGNADVVSGSETLGKGKGYLEIALEQAETARASLADETLTLQRLVVNVANRLQSVLHELRYLFSPCDEEPAIITHSVLFPITPPNAASDRLSTLFSSAHGVLDDISERLSQRAAAPPVPDCTKASDALENQRLQGIIDDLRSELDEAKKLHERHVAETQVLLMQIASQDSPTEPDPRDVSVELMTQPERDLAAERLERMKTELDEERRKFTNAAVRLGKEKAALETERVQFLEEKRSWHVEQMLSDLSPTPALTSQPVPQSHKIKSPRKSPMKPKVVGKVASRKTRVSRRSSSFSIPPPSKVEPAYETEVIPIAISPAAFGALGKKSTLAQSILPSAFVLPPRSPRTSLPPVEAFLPPVITTHQAPSGGKLYSSIDTESTSTSSSDASSSNSTSPPAPARAAIPKIVLPSPKTPPAPVVNTRRPFPLAKPLAPHMSHAYSPAKPSPLSRILMLANSPDSLDGVSEASEDSPTSAVPPSVAITNTLSSESESDDSPLREKKTEPNVVSLHPFKKAPPPESKRFSTKEKGKTQAEFVIPGKLKPEKENRDKVPRKPSPSLPPPQPKLKISSLAASKPALKLPTGKGGARRVLIGSAEAAPLPGWRG